MSWTVNLGSDLRKAMENNALDEGERRIRVTEIVVAVMNELGLPHKGFMLMELGH